MKETQNNKVLRLLQNNASFGLSDLDAWMSLSVRRLSARVLELRKLGYDIETVREPHNSGWHARYVLHKKPYKLTYTIVEPGKTRANYVDDEIVEVTWPRQNKVTPSINLFRGLVPPEQGTL